MTQRTIDMDVKTDDLAADPLTTLLPLVLQIEGWGQASPGEVQVEQLSGAMTNLVYRAKYTSPEHGEKYAIVRVFGGSNGLFERASERKIFTLMSDLRLGPKLLLDFDNGRVEEFWSGHSISADHMRQPWVAATIAAAMATFHWYGPAFVEGRGGSTATVWQRVRAWHATVVAAVGATWRGMDLGAVAGQIECLEEVLSHSLPSWTAFCHNDLQYGNMMLFSRALHRTDSGKLDASKAPGIVTRKRGTGRVRSNDSVSSLAADKTSLAPVVRFFDYEYAAFNHVGFELANHWCEYAADYHSAQPHALDWSRFPTPGEQIAFCQAYVHKLVKLRRHLKVNSYTASAADMQRSGSGAAAAATPSGESGSGSGSVPRGGSMAAMALSSMAAMVQDCRDEDDIVAVAEQLRCAALAHVPLAHLHWALWGLIQARQSAVDFDFEAYAHQRLEFYARDVEPVLRGELPPCAQLQMAAAAPEKRRLVA